MEEKKTITVNTVGSRVLNWLKNGCIIIGILFFIIGFITLLVNGYVDESSVQPMVGGLIIFISGLALSIFFPIVQAAEVYLAEKKEDVVLVNEKGETLKGNAFLFKIADVIKKLFKR